MNRTKTLASAALALLLLAACGTTGGNIGDIFGGGGAQSPSSNAAYNVRGTVDSVDTSTQSIYLTNVNGYSNSLNTGQGSVLRVYYDSRTTLEYQGRTYRPDQLERGDEVTVRVDRTGNNQLVAESMSVTYNSRGGMASSSNGTYGDNGTYGNDNGTYGNNGALVRGTVRSVDTYRRTITIDRGSGATSTVEYDANTPVTYNGRSYAPANLEVGDQIDVRTTDLGRGRLAARDILVTRTVNGRNGR